jgi:hypothetical protein
MPNTRLYDRGKSAQHAADQGTTTVVFSSGVADHGGVIPGDGSADDLSSILAQQKAVYELGRVGLGVGEQIAGDVDSNFAVPAGKYWRVIGAVLEYVASADVATRTPILSTRNTGDTDIVTVTFANITASGVARHSVLAGSDDGASGSQGVAAQATLTLDTQPTAGDTMTLDGTTYTFVAAGTEPSVANTIVMGADLAATKVIMNAIFTDGAHATVNAIDFAGNDMVFTARTKGTAGNSIACTETFTAGTNVFDAATFGTTTAGVDFGDKVLSIDFPTTGVLLTPAEDVNFTVTNGHANDLYDLYVFYIEYDHDPTA